MSGAPLMGRREWLKLAALTAVFVGVYLLPIGAPEVEAAMGEGLRLTRWYAREHVISCLLPAFVIAGAIAAYVDKAAVLRYLGPTARKPAAYGVGATSGGILAVCSCTVLPLFAGIYRMGAGVGPAIAFLYSGPAINVLAVILTARVLGFEIGVARAVGATIFSVLIGLIMAALFERRAAASDRVAPLSEMPDGGEARPLGQLATLFGLMIAALVFANWSGEPGASGVFSAVHAIKWWLTAAAAGALAFVLGRWFGFPWAGLLAGAGLVAILSFTIQGAPGIAFAGGIVALCILMPHAGDSGREWWMQTWDYTKLIAPLLLGGVFAAGFLLGTPGSRGLIPPEWIERLVGGNGFEANLGASVIGAFMYFATLTEVPILKGLLGAGMGKGPALALLLAGPALSLPSMLVIRRVIGTKRTVAYVLIVICGSTIAGLSFGAFF